jgi:molecular chaperone DnaK
MAEEFTLGVDLGTTRSAMAHVASGEVQMLNNSEGKDITPSVVHLTEDDEAVVGDDAVNSMLMQPDRTVREVKKLMGENTTVTLGEEEFTPQDISGIILQKLVENATNRLGGEVTNAVITVPAYFTDRERTATREAGELADLTVERLLPEPSAAVLAYGHKEQQLGEVKNETIFVYDLGGGTFDATLVEAEYEFNYIETVATDGDSDLGGSNWTDALVQYAYDVIEEDTGVDVSEAEEHAEQRRRIWEQSQEVKHRLSSQNAVSMTVPFVVPEKSYNLDEEITREQFEGMTEELLERTTEPMDSIFDRTDYDVESVDKVLLIGGSTRMPQVEKLVTDYFGMDPSKEISPDHAVAQGAAIQAAVLDDSVESSGLTGADDEDDSASGIALIDALSQSIGVKVQPGDRFDPIVERDTNLPATERKEGYSVRDEDQTTVEIQVYQGESELADENEFLGRAVMEDIPKRRPGQQSLAIEFTVNNDGTLEIRGEDLMSDTEIVAEIESALQSSEEDSELPPSA